MNICVYGASSNDIDKLHFAVFPKEKVTNKNTEELRKIFPEFIIDKK